MMKLVFFAVLLVGSLLLTDGASKPPAKSIHSQNLKKLLEEQLAVLVEMDRIQRATGTWSASPSYSIENEYLWSRRRLDVERALREKTDERTTALQGHADRMKRLEERVQQLAKTKIASGVDILGAKFYRLEAEYWLEQAKAP